MVRTKLAFQHERWRPSGPRQDDGKGEVKNYGAAGAVAAADDDEDGEKREREMSFLRATWLAGARKLSGFRAD